MLLLLFLHQNLAINFIQWSGCFVGRFNQQQQQKCGKEPKKNLVPSDFFFVAVVFCTFNRAPEWYFSCFFSKPKKIGQSSVIYTVVYVVRRARWKIKEKRTFEIRRYIRRVCVCVCVQLRNILLLWFLWFGCCPLLAHVNFAVYSRTHQTHKQTANSIVFKTLYSNSALVIIETATVAYRRTANTQFTALTLLR